MQAHTERRKLLEGLNVFVPLLSLHLAPPTSPHYFM